VLWLERRAVCAGLLLPLERMQAMVLTIAAVACSASDGRVHQRDSPVSPEAMQKMIGKGFDVRWAEFDGDMQE
jgi:hypothetical protein